MSETYTEELFEMLDDAVDYGVLILVRFDVQGDRYEAEVLTDDDMRQTIAGNRLYDVLHNVAIEWNGLAQRMLPFFSQLDHREIEWMNELERMTVEHLCFSLYQVRGVAFVQFLDRARRSIKIIGRGADLHDAVEGALQKRRMEED